jgi:D-alanine-D-alanine ligase
MTIEVDPDWWKTLFDDVYLLTDARSVDNEAVTRREIDIFTSLLSLRPGDRILDLCGGHGRHAIELSRRGFHGCTVLDYSQRLLDIGAGNAAVGNCPVRFLQGDARHTGLAAETFDHILILGNSLGYIPDPDADLEILRECRRLAKPRGWLLLDVTNGAAVNTSMAPQAWHEIGEDVVVCRQREVKKASIRARELVLSKTDGMIRDRTYSIRLYRADDLADLVRRAGFEGIQVHTDASALDPDLDVGCMNHRIVVAARKP